MKRKQLGISLALAVVLLVVLCGLSPAVETVNPGPDETITMALVGDTIITRRVKQFDDPRDPRFQKVVAIIREADVAFLNLEINLFRLSEFKGQPQAETGGNWELGPPAAAADLQFMGFDLMSTANNHTTDYGVEGMRLTGKLLDKLEIVHAGSGMNLGLASRPGYLDTIKGRVALISFASTFTKMSVAGASRDDMVGRGGLNPLRTKNGQPLEIDRERILHEIRNATMLSDFVIATSHTHGGNNNMKPPSWQPGFAKECIDAGAIAFVSHGPHRLRGIEIYKGKPIFYSLANFIFQNDTIDPMPAEYYAKYDLSPDKLAGELYDKRYKGDTVGFPSKAVWYESVIAVPTFSKGELVALKLHPIELNHKAPRSQRGTPRLAYGENAENIINGLAQLSAPFGTRIELKDGIGVWVLNKNSAQFISQTVSTSMEQGGTQQVSITLKNSGTEKWSRANGQRLGARDTEGNTVWVGLTGVPLPHTVAPNQEVTFTFTITAPLVDDFVNFQWQMLDESGSNTGWFGEKTSNISIAVGTLMNMVTLYGNRDFDGWEAAFGVGEFTTADLLAAGGADNDVDSVRVSSGYQVELYAEDNFEGTPEIHTSDSQDTPWHNQVSSLKVMAVSGGG